ncbi:MAG: ABC transporter substrate-binding protein [Bermanella sp.]
MARLFAVLTLLAAFVMPAQAQQDDPQSLVKGISDVVLAEILANKAKLASSPTFLPGLIETHIIPIIDQKRMAKMAVGKHWKSFSSEQKSEFVSGFKKLLIKTYAGAFKAYTGQDVTYGETKFKKSKRGVNTAKVKSNIHLAGGSPIRLIYSMYKSKQDKWLVYDANIAGLGLVKTYRAQFSEQIQRDGIEKTIARLSTL